MMVRLRRKMPDAEVVQFLFADGTFKIAENRIKEMGYDAETFLLLVEGAIRINIHESVGIGTYEPIDNSKRLIKNYKVNQKHIDEVLLDLVEHGKNAIDVELLRQRGFKPERINYSKENMIRAMKHLASPDAVSMATMLMSAKNAHDLDAIKAEISELKKGLNTKTLSKTS